MTQVFMLKAEKVDNAEGILTAHGAKVLSEYARAWVEKGERDLDIERVYPEMADRFYSIRVDSDFARDWAVPDEVSKSGTGFVQQPAFVIGAPAESTTFVVKA